MNGIRCIAILILVIHHTEKLKLRIGVPNFYEEMASRKLGMIALNSFFILSGFVITYLLFHEKKRSGGIAIKNFYIRRALRIVPLYIVLTIAAFFLFPLFDGLYPEGMKARVTDDFWVKFSLFAVFLPHVSKAIYGLVPPISHLWSIGVEEQFYAIWPWTIRKSKVFIRTLLISLVVYYVLTGILHLMVHQWGMPEYRKLLHFVVLARADMFIIGGIGAYAYFKKLRILDYVYKRSLQWIAYAVTIALLALDIKYPLFNIKIHALVSCFFILNITTNPKTILKLENALLNYVGRISYGIYLFHPIAILFTFYLTSRFNLVTSQWFDVLLYFIVFFLTLSLSTVSYEFFEKRFLKLKQRFSSVQTGELIR